MKRPVAGTGKSKGKWSCADQDFLSRFPVLSSYLCDDTWEDGKPREVSSLTVRMGSSQCNLSLSDHALQCSAFTTGETLQECLGLLEAALKDGKAVFRPWKLGKGK